MDKILSPIKERVLLFLENQSIKKSIFFKKTGISSSNFKGLGAKSELGGDKIVKIVTIFENINPEWLLTGKGNMLKEDDAHQNAKEVLHKNDINYTIRYLIDHNLELMKEESFKKYITGTIKFLDSENEKQKYFNEMDKLKEVILKKLK